MSTLLSIQKLHNWLSQQFSGKEISKDNFPITPFHCARCKFIWEKKKKFYQHINLCVHNLPELKTYAEENKIAHYDESSNSKSTIPSGRCRCKLGSGPRKGRYCLRQSTSKGGYRCLHHPFTPISAANIPNQLFLSN